MKINKVDFLYISIIFIVIICSFISRDNVFAIISSVFGIVYTILIGKGKPQGYIFGMIGTTCGSILACTLSIWGNFMLHAFCFLPMEIIGLLNWSKNMNKENKTVIKTRLKKNEILWVLILSVLMFFLLSFIFLNTKDAYPYIDSFITTFSLTGMYLTVKRCYEQWIVWTIVNLTSVIMWFNIFTDGAHVISVLIVRVVYLLLGIYFFFKWKKDIEHNFAQ